LVYILRNKGNKAKRESLPFKIIYPKTFKKPLQSRKI
jgi:hypothetical protein